MGPRKRPGVSAYLETFILIGVALAGSGVVLAAGLRTLDSASGGSVSVSGGSIRQGEYFAVESLLVENTGSVPFGSFEVTTTGVSGSASYCYSIYDPAGGSPISGSCPRMGAGPAAVSVEATVPPGRGVLVEIRVAGPAFALGSVCTVTVTTSAGAQQSEGVEAVPA